MTRFTRLYAGILSAILILPAVSFAADITTAGELYVEPPTLISLGFEWSIQGDADRDASVAVTYRKVGDTAWRTGLPLLRVGGERVNDSAHQFVTHHMFAGSIFELEPNTEYEARFVLTDPDGTSGNTTRMARVRTRREPIPSEIGNIYHVYPLNYRGPKQEPSFTGLLGAYFMGARNADSFNAYPARVKPGDTILVHAGLYKDDRYSYGGAGLALVSSGTYFLTASGTAEHPIVIKGAGDGEAIFDGDGAYNLFNVMAANYNYFEGLTIRNTELAFQGGLKNIAGSVGLTIKNCKLENIGRGVYTDWSGSKDYYIADNIIVGKVRTDKMLGFTGAKWTKYFGPEGPPKLLSEYGVKVYGSGHVVAYNKISSFHDGVDVATYGNPDGSPYPIRDRMPVSIDFYGNDISNVEDNCIEADGGLANIRIFRNRCFNMGHRALSTQPVFSGPVYFMRNIVYHAPQDGAVKFTSSSAGVLVYHNTWFAAVLPMFQAVNNQHYRNNLILGDPNTPETFSIETMTNYSSSDYNGFGRNADAQASFIWSSPPAGVVSVFPGEAGALGAGEQARLEATFRDTRKYKTLAEYQKGTGQDQHSVMVDYSIFQNARPTLPDLTILYKPEDFDFQLRPGSVAVDAGVVLLGVNDGFTGRAPDLGAYEVGRPLPHYGPRP